ncbi:MAG: efflux RND transporter periplasmic adaptor subunit [Rubrivivax sp.]|nr:efflux RND transporter periplasmic adaptor subunit [Rubrivivax sp.]
MSRRFRWVLIVTIVAMLLAVAIGRALIARRSAAVVADKAASAPAQAVDLTPGDVARATRTDLVLTLPVTGGLKAVNSAVVKAKVAAELRELLVREGDRVAAGQLIGRLDATEYEWRLRQAEDQAAAAQAQLDIAERTLANNKALVDQGFISKTALDTSISSANGARASLQAARAAAELARKAVKDSELRAPLAGLVAQRLVQPGERVPVDGRIVEIVDLAHIELEAAIAPEDVTALRVGQPASVVVDGLAQPVAARVVRINPSAQVGSRAVMAYLALDPVPGLRQGLFARGTVELRRRPALVIPARAVRHDQSRPFVLQVDGGRAVQREITLGELGEVDFGAGRESAQELLSGLAEGDIVLRATVGTLPAGTAVQLPSRPPAASAAFRPASAPRP